MESQSNARILIPVTKWNETHQWPTVGGLRYLIFHGKTNSFESCIVRVGKRVLIDEIKFFEWLGTKSPQIVEPA